MASGENDGREQPKGFAGLTSLVSDVGDAIASSNASKSPTSVTHPPSRQLSPVDGTSADSTRSDRPNQQPPRSPSGASSLGPWLLAIGIVVTVLWFASSLDNKNSTSRPSPGDSGSLPSRSSQPSTFEQLAAEALAEAEAEAKRRSTVGSKSPTAANSQRNFVETPVPEERVSAQKSSSQPTGDPVEERPPVGTDLVLSDSQLRYCVARKLRLDNAKQSVDPSTERAVDRFNAMVSDYNARCGQFRYRRGALERARSEVESYRWLIELEAAYSYIVE